MSDLRDKLRLEAVTWSDGMVSDSDFIDQAISIVLDEVTKGVNNCETRVSNDVRLNEASVMIFRDDVIAMIDRMKAK